MYVWYVLPGLIFLTFTDVMDKAVRAEIDMTFTLFITLALLLWFYLHELLRKPLIAWILSLSFVSIATLTVKVLWASLYFPYHVEHLSHYRTAAQQMNMLIPTDAHLYDYRVDNPHLAYYLKRPVTLIKSPDTSKMKSGAVVFMEKKDAEHMDVPGFFPIGEVEMRKKIIILYEITNGGKDEN